MLKMNLQQFGGRGSSGSGGGGGSASGGSMAQQFDKYEDETIEQYTLKDGTGEVVRYKDSDTYDWRAQDNIGYVGGEASSLSEAMSSVLSISNRRTPTPPAKFTVDGKSFPVRNGSVSISMFDTQSRISKLRKKAAEYGLNIEYTR